MISVGRSRSRSWLLCKAATLALEGLGESDAHAAAQISGPANIHRIIFMVSWLLSRVSHESVTDLLPSASHLLYSVTICKTCSRRRFVFSPVPPYGRDVFRLKLQLISSANAQIKIVNPLEGPAGFLFLLVFH